MLKNQTQTTRFLLVEINFHTITDTEINKKYKHPLMTGSTTCQQNELLEEARVMASVTHPCCIKIMAVCMARQLMLVTPLIKEGELLILELKLLLV